MIGRMGKRTIIGVMGGSRVSAEVADMAYELGTLIAESGWVLLNGGRDAGVMRTSAEGAKSRGGLTIGVLPGSNKWEANPFIDIPIVTSLSDGRNLINALSSDIVVACQGSAGTISEIALALKNGKNVVLLDFDIGDVFQEFEKMGQLHRAENPRDCLHILNKILESL